MPTFVGANDDVSRQLVDGRSTLHPVTDRSKRTADSETVRVRPSEASGKLRESAIAAPTKPQVGATRPMVGASSDTPPPEPVWDLHGKPHSRAPGDMFGRYSVLSLLGTGGMGEVYTAYDPALDRRIALKVLRPHPDEGSMSAARTLLLAEAQALAKLSHPNIVSVFDVGTVDDDVYLAMEYIEGTTLTKWLRDARALTDVLDVFVHAGRGLEAAHAAGIVHRDFKPDNVILGKDGRPRVIDFGIAQQAASADDTISGTPAYMAPEQFKHGKVGPAADQFAFAVTLYLAVFKTYPFAGDNDAVIERNIVAGNVLPPPATPGVPAKLRDAILKGLSKDAASRFASIGDFLDAITPAPKRSRMLFAAAGAAVVVAAGVTVFAVSRSDAAEPCTGFERDLAGVWDGGRKASLQSKVKAEAWPAIEKLFDAYTTDWTRNKVSACRATAVTKEQSPAVLERRMSCLDTRLRELDAAVAIVAAGGTASNRAIDIGTNLRAPSSCANLAALSPSPTGAPESARVSIEAGIAQLRAKRLAGEFSEARKATAPVIASAQALKWTSAVARALLERGQAESADGDPKAARETLFESVRTSVEAHDLATEAAAWIGLVQVEAGGLRAPSESLRWAKHAEIVLANAGNDQEQQAELLHNIAAALRVLDRNAEALDHERRSLALVEHAFGQRHVRVANQRAAVATCLRLTGDLDGAIREAEAALTMLEELAGLTHPYVASLLNGLALTYDEAGRIDDARKSLERAIVISELELGENHLRLANPLMNLVSIERRAGHADTAEALWERAFAIRKSNLGANHPDVTRALHGKLLDRINRGLDAEARAMISEVVTRQRARQDAIELSSALSLRCELERREGKLDAAKTTCAESIATLAQPIDPVRALYVYSYAARVATQRKDFTTARGFVQQAQTFLASATRDRNVARGIVTWAAAHLALATGDAKTAVTLAADAKASLLAHGKHYLYLQRDLDTIR